MPLLVTTSRPKLSAGQSRGSDVSEELRLPAQCCAEIKSGVAKGEILWRDGSAAVDAEGWASLLDDLDHGEERRIFACCVTDTLHSGDDDDDDAAGGTSTGSSIAAAPSIDRASLLASMCRRRRIPINVADKPHLCDFSFPATHRFSSSIPPSHGGQPQSTPVQPSSLQIAVTTNGRGCRLAGRIRREIVSALPRNVGDAVERVGEMRELAKQGRMGNSQRQASIAAGTADAGYQKEREDYFTAPSSSQEGPTAQHRRQLRGRQPSSRGLGSAEAEEDDLSYDTTPLNSPVPQLGTPGLSDRSDLIQRATTSLAASRAAASSQALREEDAERTKRRMRWVAQISEYWPIEYLGGMSSEQMSQALESFGEDNKSTSTDKGTSKEAPVGASSAAALRTLSPEEEARRGRSLTPIATKLNPTSEAAASARSRSQHSLSIVPPPPPQATRRGQIYLLGSGPGHPGLLTVMAHRLLTSPETDLVLSDKLVPAPILRLIPKRIPTIIAKKFPGNAEGAQSELISLALQAAIEKGQNVVRLKQGDPFVYGRGGEEVLAFTRAGVQCSVVPGISSALAGPSMLGIPVTQRGCADSLVLCTGVGRGGKKVKLPGYERARSLLMLMGVARLREVVDILTRGWSLKDEERGHTDETGDDRVTPAYPPYTPIAIIERASSSDQRLLASTLAGIHSALAAIGEQRPPGMIMIGWSVLSLHGENGNVDVLDDEAACAGDAVELERRDKARVARWLGTTQSDGDAESATTSPGYIVREGLDDAYAKALRDLAGPAQEALEEADEKQKTEQQRQEPQQDRTNGSSSDGSLGRSATGWAPGRYESRVSKGTAEPDANDNIQSRRDGVRRSQQLQGGWTSAEADHPNVAANDMDAWAKDQEYARREGARGGVP